MDLSVVSQKSVTVVHLKGSLKLDDGVGLLSATFERLMHEGHHKFVLNVSEMPQIDSSGIGLLVRTHTDCVKHGGGIALVQPTNFAVHTLRLVGVLRLFKVVNSDNEGLAVFGEDTAVASKSVS